MMSFSLNKSRKFIYKSLRSLEKITKTDMVYLAKGGSWLGSSQVVMAILTLALAVVFARVLSKEIYGNYQYVLSLANILTALFLTGMGLAIVRSVARGFEGTFSRSLRLYAKWSLMGSAVALLAALYYFINDNTALAYSLAIVSIGAPVFNTSLLARNFLNGLRQFKLSAWHTIIIHLIPTVMLIVVGTLFSHSVPLLILAYFVGYAGTTYLLLRRTLRLFPPNEKIDEADITYGKHISIMNSFTHISTHIDKVLIFQFLGAVPVAIYVFAIALPHQIRRFHKIIGSLILPKLSANIESRSLKNIFHKTVLLVIMTAVIVGVYILSAPFLFTVLFPAYAEATIYSQVFALSLIVSAVGFLPLKALKAARAQKQLYIYHAVVPPVRIFLLIILTVLYGIWGAIFAQIISLTFDALILVTLFYLHNRSKF